ncbi:MAG: dTDP-4-dehydrorhamnose 3,5-epimerase family protein [Halobacteriovoraceae bacterium]|nr:dTDP-4-dehydrorhamnose 3,5-epimerase family protein [Halobacteriovoraceae bacterium]
MDLVDTKIDGLKFIKKNVFRSGKGAVLKHLSIENSEFDRFGEVYYSVTNPNEVKGWKFHKEKSQNIVVIHGDVQFVFYDDRSYSKTKGNIESITISPDNYYMIKFPSKIWYSFKCTSPHSAIIGNLTDIPHHPDEVIEKPLDNSFPFMWE